MNTTIMKYVDSARIVAQPSTVRPNNFRAWSLENIMNVSIEHSGKQRIPEASAARIAAVPSLCALVLASAVIAACSDSPGTAVARVAQPSAYIESAKSSGEAAIGFDAPGADGTRTVVYEGQPATPVLSAAQDAGGQEGGASITDRELGTASDGGYFSYPER